MGLPEIDLIEPPKAHTATEEISLLKYETLPTTTSIRLLKIHHLPSIKDDLDLFRPTTLSVQGREHYGEELFKDMEAVLFFKMNDFISAETLRSMEVEEWKARTDDVMKDFTNLQILKGALPYGTYDTQNPKHFAEARAVILSCKEKGVEGRVWQISLPTGMTLMVD
ncbi:hypothetical protein LZL87_011389 [Fusarium oxysporum]|nr:hypothetical protein LZL87_011389 [Fusarium oxysporum]